MLYRPLFFEQGAIQSVKEPPNRQNKESIVGTGVLDGPFEGIYKAELSYTFI